MPADRQGEKPLGFAEIMSSFSQLSQLEEQIQVVVERSRIPPREVRRFVNAEDIMALKNTPLFQFLVDIFKTLNIGDLEVVSRSGFNLKFNVMGCKVCSMFPDVEGQKVCYPVVDLLSRFFKEDMGLGVECEEVECVKDGGEACSFAVNLHPLSVLPYILDETDMAILDMADEGGANVNTVSERFNLDPEEAIFRLERLHDLKLLRMGNVPSEFASLYREHIVKADATGEDFDPPWKDFAAIANAVAGAVSFAQALKDVAPDEVMPWEEEGEGVVELKKKAESSRSFAEFIGALEDEMDETDDE